MTNRKGAIIMEKKALYAGVLSMLLALITQALFIYGT
jgi:hypothetical protein